MKVKTSECMSACSFTVRNTKLRRLFADKLTRVTAELVSSTHWSNLTCVGMVMQHY